MGRRPTVHLHLPPGMRAKKGKRGQFWYYLDKGVQPDGTRPWVPLGSSFPDALRAYAEKGVATRAEIAGSVDAAATAMVSALTGKPARHDVAMTGEITLRGKVLPIGGVKEKLLAAHRFGLKTIILPKENEKDLADIPEEVREDLTIHAVDRIDEVLNIVLEAKKTDEILEIPQIWSPDSTTSSDISAVIK